MSEEEVLKQLESIKENAESFLKCENDIWSKDIQAIDYCIKLIKKMAKKQKQNICGENQDYSTVGLVYTDLVNYAYDQKIFVVLPDGTRHKIEYINSVSHNLETMQCEIYLKKPEK